MASGKLTMPSRGFFRARARLMGNHFCKVYPYYYITSSRHNASAANFDDFNFHPEYRGIYPLGNVATARKYWQNISGRGKTGFYRGLSFESDPSLNRIFPLKRRLQRFNVTSLLILKFYFYFLPFLFRRGNFPRGQLRDGISISLCHKEGEPIFPPWR